jgi:hypothetical protein
MIYLANHDSSGWSELFPDLTQQSLTGRRGWTSTVERILPDNHPEDCLDLFFGEFNGPRGWFVAHGSSFI